MKTLDKLQSDLNFKYYKVITFKHAATNTKLRRKGYDFYFSGVSPLDTNVYNSLTFEPCYYSNGDKWLIYGTLVRRYLNGVLYAKNLPEARKKVLNLFK